MAVWYNTRSLEPVIYKGNRANLSWQFVTTPAEMEQLYKILLIHGAKSIGGFIVQDEGLEADDTWGILAKTFQGRILGYSSDSDWGQLICDQVQVYNFTRDVMQEPSDIRVKWIGGDPGDNVPGVPKLLKSGEKAKNNWGQAGAIKLLAEHPEDWHQGLDTDALERNYALTTLPCPDWDLENAAEWLHKVTTAYEETDEFWGRYGVTLPVRKHLQDKAARDAWISRLRTHLLEQAV